MGFLLIQDHGEKEMIRLAFGPESLVQNIILKVKKELGISPFLSRQNSSSSSSSSMRILNGGSSNLPSPLSIPNQSSSWASSSFSDFQNHEDFQNPTFYGEPDLMDEINLQEQLAFLNDKNPDYYEGDHMLFPPFAGGVPGHPHRRSCSVSDINLGSEDPSGFGWKPCLYYAKGYCKNGTNCRFAHGGGFEEEGDLHCQELLRSKSLQQQRLAAASQLLGSPNFPYSPNNKCMNFDSPRAAAAAALMMNDEMHKFNRNRFDRNEFAMMNPGSRQIYLTFPADSTFSEEDVSNYFSIYGPVQDVRIPYQQKRMFGFVTFHYPETVKLILAKGNPHFVCDARVLVKPYKEKGKVPDKFRKQQQMERGEFSACGSPTGLDSRDPFDIQIGPRMFYNAQDLLWRRKMEEQADLQQAIELQSRRLMGLQLLDAKRHNHHHRALSTGAAISPPIHSPNFLHQNMFRSSSPTSPELNEEDNLISANAGGTSKEIGNQNNEENGKRNEESEESLEHNLPDNLFASPKAAAGEYPTVFISDEAEKESNGGAASNTNNTSISTSSTSSNLVPPPLDMASIKSCYFQPPRFASGHGAIGM
jgi:hypothetical protein